MYSAGCGFTGNNYCVKLVSKTLADAIIYIMYDNEFSGVFVSVTRTLSSA